MGVGGWGGARGRGNYVFLGGNGHVHAKSTLFYKCMSVTKQVTSFMATACTENYKRLLVNRISFGQCRMYSLDKVEYILRNL